MIMDNGVNYLKSVERSGYNELFALARGPQAATAAGAYAISAQEQDNLANVAAVAGTLKTTLNLRQIAERAFTNAGGNVDQLV